MPLADHFHPPLSTLRHWESFHSRWAVAIADRLNADLLPPGYFAEEQIHIGSRVDVDVATLEEGLQEARAGGVATLPARAWAPAKPWLLLPALFPDSLEVLLFSGSAGPTLVAAVELVSPGNKDRPEARRAFAAKCASYLQQGVGLVVVDVVTSRQANLHNELMELLGHGPESRLPAESLYTTAYRPVRREDADQIEAWSAPLAVGQNLPLVPLALGRAGCVPLDLDATYADAFARRRWPESQP